MGAATPMGGTAGDAIGRREKSLVSKAIGQSTSARFAITFALVCCTSCVQAADLVGTARDPRGRVLARVPITLKAADAGREKERAQATTTTDAGEFAFVGIRPGRYVLTCPDTPVAVKVVPGINRRDCRKRP